MKNLKRKLGAIWSIIFCEQYNIITLKNGMLHVDRWMEAVTVKTIYSYDSRTLDNEIEEAIAEKQIEIQIKEALK